MRRTIGLQPYSLATFSSGPAIPAATKITKQASQETCAAAATVLVPDQSERHFASATINYLMERAVLNVIELTISGISVIENGKSRSTKLARPALDYYKPSGSCLLYTSDAADE